MGLSMVCRARLSGPHFSDSISIPCNLLPCMQAARVGRARDHQLHYDRPLPALTMVSELYFISKQLGARDKKDGGPPHLERPSL